MRTTCLTEITYHSIIWKRITHNWAISVNLLDDVIYFCTAFVIVIFVDISSWFSISTPLRIMSNFLFLFNLWKLGIKCSIRSNNIRRSSEYRKQSKKKCSGDSILWWQKHSGLSERPITNRCCFKSERPTRIFVKREFPNFDPFEKCLYFGCLNLLLISDLKICRSLDWIFLGNEFQSFSVFGKNDFSK